MARISYKKFVDHMFRDRTKLRYVQPIKDSNRLTSAVCVEINSGRTLAVWVNGRGIVWEAPAIS